MAITHSVSKHMRLSEPTTKIWMKINPYYQRRRCSPMTLGSGNIRLMRIFAGVLWRRVVKQQWGNRKRVGFHAFRRYVFGTLGNEANIIIQYYLVPCCLSTDPKIRDLEWLWMAWRAILRYMFTITNGHWLIICYLFTVTVVCLLHVWPTHVTRGEVREAEYRKQWSAERQNIWNPRKICGSSVDAISSES